MVLAAWSGGLAGGCTEEEAAPCPVASAIQVDGNASPPSSDGSVKIFGTTRFAPPVTNSSGTEYVVQNERTIHDVYVDGLRVTQPEFNFRSWSVDVPADRLCAHALDEATAALPVRVYLSGPQGTCVWETPVDQRIRVSLEKDACAGAVGGSGSSGGASSSNAGGGGGTGGGGSSSSSGGGGGTGGGP
jgi:hypothetical protein